MKYVSYFLWYFFSIVFLALLGFSFYLLYKKGYTFSILIVFFLYVLSFLFNITLFLQERNYMAKLSWIIVMTILPFFGHIIFVIFGKRYSNRQSFHQYLNNYSFQFEKWKNNKNNKNHNILYKQSLISHRDVYKSDIQIYKNGNDGYNKLFQDMKKAKSFINIHYYILKPGEIFEEFKHIILQKAKQGIKIRMIIDDFGRWSLPIHEIKNFKKHGIEIKLFSKVYFPFIGGNNGYRTHCKIIIIDGQIVHVGGINIADEYANLNKKFGKWIDYHSTMKGGIVKSYSLLFINNWYLISNELLDIKKHIVNDNNFGDSKCVLIEDAPYIKENILENSLISWIYNAKKSIKISTPYFVPTKSLFDALKYASLAGLDVEIFIPGKSDKKIAYFTSLYYAQKLSQYGVKFSVMKNAIIHSKIGLFDNDYGYLGSFNCDIRSFYSQLEIANLVSGPIIEKIEKIFKEYKALSLHKKFKSISRYNIFYKLVQLFVLIFAPLI